MPPDPRHSPPPSVPSVDPQAAFAAGTLMGAVRRLSGRLEAAARQLHSDDGLSVGERALLLHLRQGGHQAIPALAARHGVTRQYVQQTLAPMTARGLVEWRRNPRHRRSRLAALTPEGVDLARRVLARGGAQVGALSRAASRRRLVEATEVLAALEAELSRVLSASADAGPGVAPAQAAGQARA